MCKQAIQDARIDAAGRGQPTVLIQRHIESGLAEVIDRRIARSRVKCETGSGSLGSFPRWVQPSEVRNASDVEEDDRLGNSKHSSKCKMIEWDQWRTLPSVPHVVRTEVPGHWHSEGTGQRPAVSDLARASRVGKMECRLAMEPDQFRFIEAGQEFDMRRFDQAGGGIDLAPVFVPQCGTKDLPFGRRIGSISRSAEFQNANPVCQDHRGIHAVQGRAGHRARHPKRTAVSHGVCVAFGARIEVVAAWTREYTERQWPITPNRNFLPP